MKDGTTHLAHKAEHAVDLGKGGHGEIVAVNICDAAAGDTATLGDTLTQAAERREASDWRNPLNEQIRAARTEADATPGSAPSGSGKCY